MLVQNEPRVPSDLPPLEGSGDTAGERNAKMDVDGVAEEM